MKNFLAVGSLVGLLGGCSPMDPMDQISRWDREVIRRACAGSVAYSNCLHQKATQKSEEDDDDRRRRRNR